MAKETDGGQFLADAANKLAQPEHAELRRELGVFIDFWGLDAYTPPEHVEDRVREIVKGFLYAAQIAARAQTEGEGET